MPKVNLKEIILTKKFPEMVVVSCMKQFDDASFFKHHLFSENLKFFLPRYHLNDIRLKEGVNFVFGQNFRGLIAAHAAAQVTSLH